jgi:hypothetical protein
MTNKDDQIEKYAVGPPPSQLTTYNLQDNLACEHPDFQESFCAVYCIIYVDDSPKWRKIQALLNVRCGSCYSTNSEASGN